jgi:hypothetical protein
MRHLVVRRTAFLLGVMLVASAGLFAVLVSREPAVAPAVPPPAAASTAAASAPQSRTTAPTRAELYEAHCASCHTAASLRQHLPDSEERRRDLDVFLENHGSATQAEDRLIVEYLAAEGE